MKVGLRVMADIEIIIDSDNIGDSVQLAIDELENTKQVYIKNKVGKVIRVNYVRES